MIDTTGIKTPRPLRVLMPVVILGLTMFIALLVSVRIGTRMVEQYVPLEEASVEIRQELSQFHLALERYIYLHRTTNIHEIWNHLNKAEWYARAMLEGWEGPDGVYVPLKDPDLRREILKIQTELHEMRTLAEERLEAGTGAQSLESERRFDLLLELVFQQAITVQDSLHYLIRTDLREYETIIIGLLFACVTLTGAIGAVLYRYERRRAYDIALLSQSEEGLRKHEKELGAAFEKIRESEAKFRSLVEESLVGVYILQDWRFIYVNPRMAGIFGYSREELLALGSVLDITHPGSRQFIEEKVKARLSGEVESVHYNSQWVKKGGAVIDIEVIGARTEYEGRPAIIGTLLDITERRDLERQRADFFAMITHDIKSPLSVVQGFSELLLTSKADSLDPESREMVASIQKSGQKLLRLVEDYLALARMESDQLVLNESPADTAEMLREAFEEFSVLASKKGLALKADMPEGLPKIVMDKKMVLRAVSNLLQNSVNYTPRGGDVTLKAERVTEGGDFIAISVSDTGPGIPPEYKERVFEKYFRLPQAAGVKGSGLGLAIVKAVAEAHGGRVELESAPGEGSTFRLLLPVKS